MIMQSKQNPAVTSGTRRQRNHRPYCLNRTKDSRQPLRGTCHSRPMSFANYQRAHFFRLVPFLLFLPSLQLIFDSSLKRSSVDILLIIFVPLFSPFGPPICLIIIWLAIVVISLLHRLSALCSDIFLLVLCEVWDLGARMA